MTKQEAIQQLREQNINTAMWKALGLPFEYFLRFTMFGEYKRQKVINELIDHFGKQG